MFRALFTAGMLLITAFTYGQRTSNWQISAGVNPGVSPTGPFTHSLGGDLSLQKRFGRSVSGTLTAGFTHFFEKDHFATYPQYGSPYNVIPVKAGILIFLSDKFYVGGEAGVGFAFEQWGTSFVWSPSVGLALNNHLDISLKWEDYIRSAATKTLALRIAYRLVPAKSIVQQQKAQIKSWQLGVNINPGITVTPFAHMVLGGEMSIYKHVTNHLEASLTGGINYYFHSYPLYYLQVNEINAPSVTIDHTTRAAIPLKAGLRIHTVNRFYVGCEAGAALAAHWGASFVFSPSAGLHVSDATDIGLKYEHYNSNHIPDQLALRIGHRFQ